MQGPSTLKQVTAHIIKESTSTPVAAAELGIAYNALKHHTIV